MGRVASVGSVNVDHVRYGDGEWVADCRERYDWFPGAGETRTVEGVPEAFAAAFEGDPGAAASVETFLGGKGANQAVAAAAAGADAALYGAVGADADEYGVISTLADRGVDVAGVDVVDGPTGAAYVAVDADGENYIAVVPGANGVVDGAHARRAADGVAAADCVLVQNELPVDAVLAALDALADAADRPLVVFDPAPAEGAAAVVDHPAVDVLTPNDGETAALEDAIAEFEGCVVRTLGADGVAVDPGRRRDWATEPFELEPPAVDPVDTTGAGDVFDGYLAAALADGRGLRAAVDTATVAAALSTTAEGVQRAVPDPEAVRARRE